MAGPSLSGGNPENYRVGKGIVKFQQTDDTLRDLGNCTEATLTPDVETLEHFSSRSGLKTKDKEIVLQVGGTVALTMEEFTPYNVALQTIGTLDEAAVGGPEIDIFTNTNIEGQLTIEATNDVGPKWDWTLYRCSVTPTGDFGAIEDEWGNMELEMNVLQMASGPHAGKFGLLKQTNLVEAS
jgi:hypothetical protein